VGNILEVLLSLVYVVLPLEIIVYARGIAIVTFDTLFLVPGSIEHEEDWNGYCCIYRGADQFVQPQQMEGTDAKQMALYEVKKCALEE
jgi:hypothetical protein